MICCYIAADEEVLRSYVTRRSSSKQTVFSMEDGKRLRYPLLLDELKAQSAELGEKLRYLESVLIASYQ